MKFAASQSPPEVVAIYYLARQLGRINVLALAEYEGLSRPAQPDRLVSEQESRLTIFGAPFDEFVTNSAKVANVFLTRS